MRPEEVRTQYFRPIQILFDGGDDGTSVAFGWWMPDTPERELCIAQRWNGANGKKGYPSSRGYPQWYIEDNLMAPAILQRIAYGSFPQEPRQLNRLAAARALRDLYTPHGYGTEAGIGPHEPPSEPEQTEATA
jgi:hypothetical protein